MKKQEAIEKLESRAFDIEDTDLVVGLRFAKHTINQIDESEKPIVPQYVAEWLKYCESKGFFLTIIFNGIGTELFAYEFNGDMDKCTYWARNHQKEIAKAWLYGYEVEKEKLYTVEIPNPNGGTYLALCKDVDGKLFFDAFFSEEWKTFGKCKLTETEIKKDFEWAWQFAEEVEK